LNIVGRTISWSDISGSGPYWPEEKLRRSGEVAVHYLDFEFLPWTAALVAAPLDHVFASAPRSSGFLIEEAVDVGPLQARWTRQASRAGELKMFRKELRKAGIKEQQIREGSLPFEGDLESGNRLRFAKDLRPVSDFWFRAYLIPQEDSRKARLNQVLQNLAAERGEYFVRRFPDRELERLAASGWTYPYSSESATREAYLFHFLTGADSGPAGPAKEREKHCIALLRNAIEDGEAGKPIDFASLTPAVDDLWEPSLAFPSPESHHAWPRSIRSADAISALRLRLIRLLGWPIFFYRTALHWEAANDRFRNGPKGAEPLSFDPLQEMSEYLDGVRRNYPSYRSPPLEAAWSGE